MNKNSELNRIGFMVDEIFQTKNRIGMANEEALQIEMALLNQQVISLYGAIQQAQAGKVTSSENPTSSKSNESNITSEKHSHREPTRESLADKIGKNRPYEVKDHPPKPVREVTPIIEKPTQGIVKEEKVIIVEERPSVTVEKVEEKQKVSEPVQTPIVTETKVEPPVKVEIVAEKPMEVKEEVTSSSKREEPKNTQSIHEKMMTNKQSLNDKFANQFASRGLADKMKLSPIHDLRVAIDLNQKIAFTKQLFNNDDKDYKKVITFINDCKNFSEAKFYVQQEVASRLNWEENNPLVLELMELVYRKFL